MDEIIYCCRLTDHSAVQELSNELLTALEMNFSTWCDRETGVAIHTVYCADQADAELQKQRLEENLPAWRELGLDITDLEITTIRKEDWSEVWKQYFHVLEITPRLIVKPSWREYQAKPGQVIVELDPGMSFGTGQHATTSFCLKMIDRLADGTPRSFLDAGCGSGILSIAAWKLGYRPVHAFDYDPEAVQVAVENLTADAITREMVKPRTADLAEYVSPLPEGFDVVAANILAPVLIRNREKIKTLVKPGGRLILAGILITEFDAVATAFAELGFIQLEAVSEKEWRGGCFRRDR